MSDIVLLPHALRHWLRKNGISTDDVTVTITVARRSDMHAAEMALRADLAPAAAVFGPPPSAGCCVELAGIGIRFAHRDRLAPAEKLNRIESILRR